MTTSRPGAKQTRLWSEDEIKTLFARRDRDGWIWASIALLLKRSPAACASKYDRHRPRSPAENDYLVLRRKMGAAGARRARAAEAAAKSRSHAAP